MQPITITYQKLKSHEAYSPVEFCLRIEVTGTTGGVSPNIFVWQRRDAGADKFMTVASPADMVEVPDTREGTRSDMPFYRTNTLELVFRDFKDYTYYSRRIDERIRELTKALNDMQSFNLVDVITV